MKDHIFELLRKSETYLDIINHRTYTQNESSCEIFVPERDSNHYLSVVLY